MPTIKLVEGEQNWYGITYCNRFEAAFKRKFFNVDGITNNKIVKCRWKGALIMSKLFKLFNDNAA